ncbi:MAG: cation:proton antiporter [Flavobacteriales bacterium]|nr:cation:proton antiporter [Flavobacteriales bacterium]
MTIDINAYYLVIAASLVIIFSYFANVISRKTNIPSVLLLIILGVLIKQSFPYFGLSKLPYEGLILEVLGTVGLIFIVLEAALDLELRKDKWPIIWKSMLVALGALLFSSFGIAGFLYWIFFDDFFNALVYAIPLSIMSSAIIIPSVGGLVQMQKEFMVYESTFSDILGIMFFYLLLGNEDAGSVWTVVKNVGVNISVTIVLGLVVSYIMVFMLQKITGNVKLFLTIAVLLLIYAIEKLVHLSPLILVLAFGLMLNNHKLFFVKRMRQLVNDKKIESITKDFHVLTLETAFVIRTFFFVIFGITIVLSSLMNWSVIFYSLVIVVILYLVRFLFLMLFARKDTFPMLYIAPRGLITILLYFQIYSGHPEYVHDGFDQGILLVVIMVTSIIMTISLIQNGFGVYSVKRDERTSEFAFLHTKENSSDTRDKNNTNPTFKPSEDDMNDAQ